MCALYSSTHLLETAAAVLCCAPSCGADINAWPITVCPDLHCTALHRLADMDEAQMEKGIGEAAKAQKVGKPDT